MHAEGTTLAIKAQPRASKTEIVGMTGTELKIRIAAPPVDFAANEVLLEFLADQLNCPKASVQLLRGRSAGHKIVLFRGLDVQNVAAKLGI
jgi:uncharacterized protein (TIGR00251 family)